MTGETPDRAASELRPGGWSVRRRVQDGTLLSDAHFFSGCSGQRASERPPDRGDLRRAGTRRNRGAQVEHPGAGGVAQPRQAAQGRHVCGIGSIRRCGLGHDVPRARISQVLPTENRHHVVDHQSTWWYEPGPHPSRLHLERRLLRPGTQEFGSNRIHRSAHPEPDDSRQVHPRHQAPTSLLDEGPIQTRGRKNADLPQLAVPWRGSESLPGRKGRTPIGSS